MKNIIGICLLLLAASVDAADSKWSVYQSENFNLYTDLNDKAARNLVKDFENFRKAVLSLLSFPKTDENARLKIIVYSQARDYNQIKPQSNIAGFFLNSSTGPRMVIGPGNAAYRTEVLYHEYIHHLIQEHVNLPIPRWYNEGFAELLATTEIKGKNVSSGKLNTARLQSLQVLNPLPLERLFKPFDEEASAIYMERYYATSMLFMHFLQVAPLDSGPDLRPGLSYFLYRLSTGEDPMQAIEPSFGMTPAQLANEFGKYRNKRSFRFLRFELEPYDGEIRKQKLSINEHVALMADMASTLRKEELALEYLKGLDESQPDAALGLSQYAVIKNHQDNVEAALQARDKALELNDSDAEVLANIAHVYWDVYTRSLEQGEPDESLLDQVLEKTQAALARDPDNLWAYEFQIEALRARQQHTEALQSMMAVYQRLPSSIAINANIGEYLITLRRPDLARPFIERVQNWSHDPAVIQRYKNMLDDIDRTLAEQEEV